MDSGNNFINGKYKIHLCPIDFVSFREKDIAFNKFTKHPVIMSEIQQNCYCYT